MMNQLHSPYWDVRRRLVDLVGLDLQLDLQSLSDYFQALAEWRDSLAHPL